jgi:hypothetical protein
MWAVLYEVRSEYAQMLTVLFLLINGRGISSLDAVLGKGREEIPSQLVAASRRKESANASVMV